MKLIMTLLVRDEQDIVCENINFHRSQGVDFFIATDNKSEDSTPYFLKRYEKMGFLHYIYEGNDNYNQHEWVTRMARMAYDVYHADWVINNDADEFWWPKHGNLKDTFSAIPPEFNIVKAERYNFVAIDNETVPFYKRMVYRERKSFNLFGNALPPKVAHKGSANIHVMQGNHNVAGLEDALTIDNLIEILHFPIRSYKQLENKIVKGGGAYERNKELPEELGCTWRELYKEYRKNSQLSDYFNRNIYDHTRISQGLDSNTLIKDNRLNAYLSSLTT